MAPKRKRAHYSSIPSHHNSDIESAVYAWYYRPNRRHNSLRASEFDFEEETFKIIGKCLWNKVTSGYSKNKKKTIKLWTTTVNEFAHKARNANDPSKDLFQMAWNEIDSISNDCQSTASDSTIEYDVNLNDDGNQQICDSDTFSNISDFKQLCIKFLQNPNSPLDENIIMKIKTLIGSKQLKADKNSKGVPTKFPEGFKISRSSNYGNCTTAAIAFLLFGDTSCHVIIRALMGEMRRRNGADYNSLLSFCKYVKNTSYKTQMASIENYDLQLICDILDISLENHFEWNDTELINVLSKELKLWDGYDLPIVQLPNKIYGDNQKKTYHLFWTKQERKNEKISESECVYNFHTYPLFK